MTASQHSNQHSNQHGNTSPARSPGLLSSIGPGLFAAPMGLLGTAHVLYQLFQMEGAPFGALASAVFVLGGLVLLGVTLLYGARALTVAGALRADFSDPVKMNFGSALGIALILLARGLALYDIAGASQLLALGCALSIGFAVAVVRQWFTLAFAPGSISPAWFVPVASTLVAAKALADAGSPILGALIGGLGLFGWIMLLPLIVRRLIVEEKLPAPLTPTLFILIAPPGLAANAALALVSGPLALGLALACLGIGLFFLAVLATMLKDFERAGFSLAAWSYTFPTAAMASAALSLAAVSGTPGLTLLAHGLAGLNIVLTAGVAVFAARRLRQKKTAPAG